MQKANISLFNKSLVITAVLAMTAPVYANQTNAPQVKTFQPKKQPQKVAMSSAPVTASQPQAMPTQMQSSQNQLTHNTKAYLVKTLQGKNKLIPITNNVKVKAGDTLEYQTTIHNNSSDRIKSMQVTLSIPQGVILLGNTSPEFVYASVNQRDFYPAPLQTQVNGVMKNITLSQYKGLRWTVKNLDLGESTTVSYRAKVQ